MPKSLDITSSSRISTAMDLINNKWWIENVTNSDLKYNNLTKEELEEWQIWIDNIKKYWHPNWYEWSIYNWWTKWDARDANIIENSPTYIEIFFDTAWSAPDSWFKKLCEKFPELDMSIYSEYEWWFGNRLFENSWWEVIESPMPDYYDCEECWDQMNADTDNYYEDWETWYYLCEQCWKEYLSWELETDNIYNSLELIKND